VRTLGLILLVQGGLMAQSVTNARAWLSYFGDHPGPRKLGLHFDGHLRMDGSFRQVLLRPGLNYYIRPNLFVTAGYAFIHTKAGSVRTPEHRPFGQLQYNQRFGIIPVTHRFRLEQRFISVGTGPTQFWRHQNRVRYFFRTELPLLGMRAFRKGWHIGLSDEIFIGFGPNKGNSAYDQNRLYAAVGKKLSPVEKIEFGYIYQNQLLRDGRSREHNHIFTIAFYSTRGIFR
jgi:hypothetical protein